MKVRTAIAKAVAACGTDTIFGVLGGGNMYIVHDLVNECGLRYVSASREDGAILMGHGFARVRGVLGLSTVTYGPGLTNAITALTEAGRARTPMLVLTGDTPAARAPDEKQGVQLIDQPALVAPTGALYRRVRSADSAVDDVADAIRTAVLERRVVVLGVPSDLQEQEVEDHAPRRALSALQAIEPDPAALDQAAGVIASSKRCVVLAGWGVVTAGAREPVLALARRLHAPLATTLAARDLFRGEPHNLGVFGTLSSSVAVDAIEAADCIIVLGASLNWFTASGGVLLKGKRVVHCDIDPLAIGRSSDVTVGVVGDAAAVARSLDALLSELGTIEGGFALDALANSLAQHRWADEVIDQSTDDTVDVRTASLRLEESLPPDRTLVTDGGRFLHSVLRYMSAPEPRRFLSPLSFAAVGAGLPSAIGAAFARPDRPTVLVTGDGGLMMSLTELNTAVQHRLDLIVVVMNDGAYGQEIYRYRVAGMEPSLALLNWPDLAPVAAAFGAQGLTVRNLRDLDDAFGAVSKRERPILIDVRIDPFASLD